MMETEEIIHQVLLKLVTLHPRANLNICGYIRQDITKDMAFDCNPIIDTMVSNGLITMDRGQGRITDLGITQVT